VADTLGCFDAIFAAGRPNCPSARARRGIITIYPPVTGNCPYEQPRIPGSPAGVTLNGLIVRGVRAHRSMPASGPLHVHDVAENIQSSPLIPTRAFMRLRPSGSTSSTGAHRLYRRSRISAEYSLAIVLHHGARPCQGPARLACLV